MAAEPARTSPTSIDPHPSGVVRPISRAADRRCSRPGCPTPASVTLAFQYDARSAVLAALDPDAGPETYDLCGDHADRTRPPHGWTLDDERPDDPAAGTPDPDDLDSPHTVAVLAAALRGDDPGAGADEHAEPTTAGDGTPADRVHEPDESSSIDTAALDAIVDEPIDDPAGLDLFGVPDDADPAEPVPDDGDPPAPRTVPGADRPA